MEENKEKWIADVLNSMNGSERAHPKKDLFAQIEAQIEIEEQLQIIPMLQWRWVAAAAVLLLCLNTLTLHQIEKQSNWSGEHAENTAMYQQGLISNYKIYD